MKTFKIVYKSDCGFCRRAVELLIKESRCMKIINVTNNQSLREAYSMKNNDWPTVPMITLHDVKTGEETFIGGYTDLVKYLEQEKQTPATD